MATITWRSVTADSQAAANALATDASEKVLSSLGGLQDTLEAPEKKRLAASTLEFDQDVETRRLAQEQQSLENVQSNFETKQESLLTAASLRDTNALARIVQQDADAQARSDTLFGRNQTLEATSLANRRTLASEATKAEQNAIGSIDPSTGEVVPNPFEKDRRAREDKVNRDLANSKGKGKGGGLGAIVTGVAERGGVSGSTLANMQKLQVVLEGRDNLTFSQKKSILLSAHDAGVVDLEPLRFKSSLAEIDKFISDFLVNNPDAFAKPADGDTPTARQEALRKETAIERERVAKALASSKQEEQLRAGTVLGF